jgi:hypothetical protein
LGKERIVVGHPRVLRTKTAGQAQRDQDGQQISADRRQALVDARLVDHAGSSTGIDVMRPNVDGQVLDGPSMGTQECHRGV